VNKLVGRISRHRRYINSGAVLPQDAINDGVLTFDVIEGKLKQIRVHGLGRLNQAYVVDRLIADPEAPLNMDSLRERFQLLLVDPLFERLNARVMPDARAGEAILEIDAVRARPYQVTLLANNYRPPSIGANAIGLSAWVRNLTGYGDMLEASVQRASQDKDGNRGNLAWSMPLNQRGAQLSIQLEHGRSAVIEEPVNALSVKSTLDSKDVGLSQSFIESLTSKLTMGINRVERVNRTFLLDQPYSFVSREPDGVTRISAWRFWQEYTDRSQSQVMALRSTFTRVNNNLQEIAGLPPSNTQAARRYVLWVGQAQYARQVLDNGAQIVLRSNLQYSPHHLLAHDQMSIGGVASVRGYRENQLNRDRGALLNAEFEYPLANSAGLHLMLIPFFDYARAKNLDESADTLSSIGIASRFQWRGLSLDVAVAKRLSYPNSINKNGGSLQDKGVHFQLAYKFF